MIDDHTLTLLLLSAAAPIGAFDSLYFHVWRFRLARRPASRSETLTHIARGVVLGVIALTLAFYEPHGAWAWLIGGLLAVDFVNNLVDASLEGASRADLGGIPRAEYVLHIAGAAMVGASTLAFGVIAAPHAFAQTALVAAAVPGWLFMNALVVGGGAFALAALEAAMLVQSMQPEHAAAYRGAGPG